MEAIVRRVNVVGIAVQWRPRPYLAIIERSDCFAGRATARALFDGMA